MKEEHSPPVTIAALQRQIGQMRAALAGLTLLVVLLGVVATIGPVNALLQVTDLVQTRELQIVDANGNMRARLAQDGEGGILEIHNLFDQKVAQMVVDTEGRPYVIVGGSGYPGWFQAENASGARVLSMGARRDDDGTGFVDVRNSGGQSGVWLNTEGNGGLVRWNNTDGQMAGFLGMNDFGGIVGVHAKDEGGGTSARAYIGTNMFNGEGVVEVIGTNQNTSFLTSTWEGTPYLSLKNRDAKTVVYATADSVGAGQVQVLDAAVQPRIVAKVSAEHGNGGLHLFNSDNSTMAELDAIRGTGTSLDGQPQFAIHTRMGTQAAQLQAFPSGGRLRILDGDGQERIRAATSGGNGYLQASNAQGNRTHFIGSTASTGGHGVIDLRNAAGGSAVIAEVDSVSGEGVIKTLGDDGSPLWQSGADEGGGTSGGTGGEGSGLLGDLDNDGDVDFGDFIKFATNFGKSIAG